MAIKRANLNLDDHSYVAKCIEGFKSVSIEVNFLRENLYEISPGQIYYWRAQLGQESAAQKKCERSCFE